MKNKIILIVVIIVITVGAGSFLYFKKQNPVESRKLIGAAHYSCSNKKSIDATYYQRGVVAKSSAGEAPIPTGSVDVSFDGGATTTLFQTISASGIRYANADESSVFWSKGKEALIMHNNVMDMTYTNCKTADII